MIRKHALWIADDPAHIQKIVPSLEDIGIDTDVCNPTNSDLLLDRINNVSSYDIIIVDMMWHNCNWSNIPFLKDKGVINQGTVINAGVVLGRHIKRTHTEIPIICVSVLPASKDNDDISWFINKAEGYFDKSSAIGTPDRFINYLKGILFNDYSWVKCFIVHGHDTTAKYELKNYLQNQLNLPEPIILHEKSSDGNTIIEKFEKISQETDLVFVLLTPDDIVNNHHNRARQNVIFELGYFIGKLGRKSKSVIVLTKGKVDFPSDLYGLVYIDITHGVEGSGEMIRREINSLPYRVDWQKSLNHSTEKNKNLLGSIDQIGRLAFKMNLRMELEKEERMKSILEDPDLQIFFEKIINRIV